MCELQLTAIVATMTTILIINIANILLNVETVRSEIYPAEGPMPKAPVAPCALVDIVRCSKSRTTVDAGRCSQSNPGMSTQDSRKKTATDHQEENELDRQQAVALHAPKIFIVRHTQAVS